MKSAASLQLPRAVVCIPANAAKVAKASCDCAQGDKLRIRALLVLILLVACATPAGKLTDADFQHTSAATVRGPVSTVLSDFFEGTRYCSADYGVAECAPVRPDGSAVCDVYAINFLTQSRSMAVVGRVEFVPIGGGTAITMRSRHGGGRWNVAWEQMAKGSGRAACPR